ncbi:heavy metal-binding domain-containing protein [Lacrimispora saccharolytica]|nr:heavy metal-binding domain-containing protein [Lacrimispora saccharolytica]
MAHICALCGKKLGIFDDGVSISKDMELCVKCNSHINMTYVVPMNKAESLEILNDKFQEAMAGIDKEKLTDSEKEILKGVFTTRRESNEKRISQENERKQRKEQEQKEQLERQIIYSNIGNLKKDYMVTTGYNFEGYRIVEYKKVVSGSTVLGTGFLSELNASISDLFGAKSDTFADKLETAKDAAYDKMIIKAMSTGANAIIGVDFDYITFENNMIGVVANGTAVVIDKVEE